GSGILVAAAAAFVFAPDLVLEPFATAANQVEMEMTRTLLRFIAFYSLFDAANLVFSFALRGAGDTKFVAKVISSVPWLGMVLPAWLSWRFGYGLYWAWGAATFYVCILAFIFYAR